MLEPSPSRGKVAPPQAVTDEGETEGLLYITNHEGESQVPLYINKKEFKKIRLKNLQCGRIFGIIKWYDFLARSPEGGTL